MLTCQQLTDVITDYTEGRMSWRGRLQVQLHLGMCRHCRAYLRQLRGTVQTLGALPPEPMPDEMKAELMRRLRGLKR